VNLEYGSYAPGARKAFIEDAELADLWRGSGRCYLFVTDGQIANYQSVLGSAAMYVVARSGGKSLYTNLPLATKTTAGSGAHAPAAASSSPG
jgi:hypothetical protein